MGPRSTAVLCTSVVSWVEAGLRKAAIASSVGGFRAGAALGIEPVISSVAGGCLPLVTFRSPENTEHLSKPAAQLPIVDRLPPESPWGDLGQLGQPRQD